MDTQSTAVEYIEAIVREMQATAEQHSLDTLAYILSVAAMDAAETKIALTAPTHE